jgi:large subunit ribosomal protein L21
MHAVIFTGGKQHKVKEGETLKIEKLDNEINDSIVFDKVLLIDDGSDIKIGAPYLEGAKVLAEIIDQGRDKKVHILKFKRRKHHMKQMGHRQYFTKVKITNIQV